MNFATIFAASCLTLATAIGGGLYIASEVQGQFGAGNGAPRAKSESLWIATPPFTLIGEDGERHRMVAAVGTQNRQEAQRLCKYLPIVRDRLQRFASSVRVIRVESGQPRLRGNAANLAVELETALGLGGTPKVKIVDSRYPLQKAVRAKPANCENGRLAS